MSSLDLHFPPWFPETRTMRVPLQDTARDRTLLRARGNRVRAPLGARGNRVRAPLGARGNRVRAPLGARQNNVAESARPVPAQAATSSPRSNLAAKSFNLDFLRSVAVLLVVAFHLAKFFNWEFGNLKVTDFGLLGVLFFFVHTTLVLMFSMERQRTRTNAPLFFPFIVRRCFRIYPLAMLVIIFVYLFRIPSDLQFGRFTLLHQNSSNLFANLLLIQNVTRQKANPGSLWSLPLEIQMYLILPALFLFASRLKSSWGMILFWSSTVALWFSAGLSTGTLPLSEGGIRSPMEALLKFTRFVPCFLPGIIAYKLWRRPRVLSGFLWPVFLLFCCTAFVLFSGREPIQTGWIICFGIGLGACLFRELPESFLARVFRSIARYSYGIYLLHYFAMWFGFVVCGRLNFGLQIGIFAATLASLPVILYHTVEAPLTAAGVKISERFESLPPLVRVTGHAARQAARNFS